MKEVNHSTERNILKSKKKTYNIMYCFWCVYHIAKAFKLKKTAKAIAPVLQFADVPDIEYLPAKKALAKLQERIYIIRNILIVGIIYAIITTILLVIVWIR